MFEAAVQVFRFEIARSLTPGRCLVWLALCLFPSILLFGFQYQIQEVKQRRFERRQDRVIVQKQADDLPQVEVGNDFQFEEFDNGEYETEEDEKILPDEVMVMICFYLVPQISCMLGLMLWTTPVVGSELEAQTWIYLSLRRHGRQAVALGKYAVAVVWTISFGVLSAIGVSALSGVDDPLLLAATLISAVLLSSFSYAALYLLIGAAFYRRATVLAFVLSVVLEGVVSLVPATINQLTVAYRLRSIVAKAMSVTADATDFILGDEPIWLNASALAAYTVLLLALAVYLVHKREYPVQTEA